VPREPVSCAQHVVIRKSVGRYLQRPVVLFPACLSKSAGTRLAGFFAERRACERCTAAARAGQGKRLAKPPRVSKQVETPRTRSYPPRLEGTPTCRAIIYLLWTLAVASLTALPCPPLLQPVHLFRSPDAPEEAARRVPADFNSTAEKARLGAGGSGQTTCESPTCCARRLARGRNVVYSRATWPSATRKTRHATWFFATYSRPPDPYRGIPLKNLETSST